MIVVDGASTDGTVDVVRRYQARDPRLELLTNPKGIVPVSLNLALAAARGAWLVRVDAHAEVPPTYVRAAVAHLRNGDWGGVGGRKDGIGRTPAGLAIAAAMRSRFGVGGSTYHHGTTMRTVEHIPFGAYPTALARQLGGWDERLGVNQDFEFDWRVRESGRQLLFDPALSIAWECRQSVGALWRQYRRYGRGKAKVALLHPRSLRLRHLLPPALVLWLTGALVGGLRRPRVAVAAIAPYLAGLGVATALTATEVDVDARRHLAPAFAAMHIAWGIGFLEGLVKAPGELRRNTVPAPQPTG